MKKSLITLIGILLFTGCERFDANPIIFCKPTLEIIEEVDDYRFKVKFDANLDINYPKKTNESIVYRWKVISYESTINGKEESYLNVDLEYDYSPGYVDSESFIFRNPVIATIEPSYRTNLRRPITDFNVGDTVEMNYFLRLSVGLLKERFILNGDFSGEDIGSYYIAPSSDAYEEVDIVAVGENRFGSTFIITQRFINLWD